MFLRADDFTDDEKKKIAELNEKIEKEKRGNNDVEKINEYYRQYFNFFDTIEKRQADEYSKNINQFVMELKAKIKHLISSLIKIPDIFNDDERLKKNIYHNLKIYLNTLENQAPEENGKMTEFINEAIRDKEKIYETSKNGVEIIRIIPENPLTQKMFSGKATNALARARTIGIFEPLEGKLVVEGVNIFSAETAQKIGVGTAKIYRYAVAEFTKHNEKNAKGEKVKQRLLLDVKDFAAANGINTNSIDAMKNFRRKLKNSLNTLLSNPITWTEKIKGKETTFSGLNYIGGYNLKSNTLNIEFTLTMAEYLTSLPLIEYPRSLYILDDRDYNAFAIGETMCIHYSIDNNVIRKTEGKLKVEILLEVTSFPTYERLKEQKLGWEANVKEPFEQKLDALTQCGFLKNWKYCYAGGKEITDEEVKAGAIDSYEKFISLIIKYELNDFAPHEERATEIIKKRAEKIKKLKSKRKNKKKTDNN